MIENFHSVNYSLYFVPESSSLVQNKYNKSRHYVRIINIKQQLSYPKYKTKSSNKALKLIRYIICFSVWIPIHLSKNPERISVYDSLLKHKEYILFATKLNAKDHDANICLDRHDRVYIVGMKHILITTLLPEKRLLPSNGILRLIICYM